MITWKRLAQFIWKKNKTKQNKTKQNKKICFKQILGGLQQPPFGGRGLRYIWRTQNTCYIRVQFWKNFIYAVGLKDWNNWNDWYWKSNNSVIYT